MTIGPYPAKFEPQPEGGYTVTFRDVPEAITQGDIDEEALSMAQYALAVGLSFYTDEGKPLPRPSAPKRGERLVFLPATDDVTRASSE